MSTSQPRFLFVVTYGRSGSTLIQGLLNALPGVLIRGENNNFLLPLYRSYLRLMSSGRWGGLELSEGAQHAWYGASEVSGAKFIEDARTLVTNQLLGSRASERIDTLGFKEIRWSEPSSKEWPGFVGFLHQAFLSPRFVLLRRDPEQVMKSSFMQAHGRDKALDMIGRTEDRQDSLAERFPERCLRLSLDSLLADPNSELTKLATFVVESAPPELLGRLKSQLLKPHSTWPESPAYEGSVPSPAQP